MAISQTGGELYVIGEVDPRTGAKAPFVKIGIVRDNENRTTDQRVKEHQTGNPRLLVVRTVVKTPMVERVETALHDNFAPFRISGEWFHMDDAKVDNVITTAKQMAKEAGKKLQAVKEADELRKQPSDGTVRSADKAGRKLYQLCVESDAVPKVCDDAAKLARETLIGARKAKVDVEAFLRIIPKAGTSSINQDALQAEHPKIWSKFRVTKQTISARFTLASARGLDIDVATVAPELVGAAAQLSSRATAAARTSKGFDKVHRAYLEMLSLMSPRDWIRELAEEELRAACGVAAEIEGVCKWNRSLTESTTFDSSAFKKAHPELAEKYTTTKPDYEAFAIAKDRNFRL